MPVPRYPEGLEIDLAGELSARAQLIARLAASGDLSLRAYRAAFPVTSDFALGLRFAEAMVLQSRLETERVVGLPVSRWTVVALVPMASGFVRDIEDAVRSTVAEQSARDDGVRQDGIFERVAARIVNKGRIFLRDVRGKATRIYQRSTGVERYIWRAKNDGRTRKLHADLDGQEFSWNEGHPTEGHPGDSINCRCDAEPISPKKGRTLTIAPLIELIRPRAARS